MPLSYERRNVDDDLCWFYRPLGQGSGAIIVRDCFLLESDTGTLTDDLLLEDDSMGCLLLESDEIGPPPPPTEFFLLLQSASGAGDSIVLLQSGGSDGVKLQDSI